MAHIHTRYDKSIRYCTINPCFTQIAIYTRKTVQNAGLPPFAYWTQYKGVLDSCPIGPGLSKIIEWTSILFRQDWHQSGKVQSCCVILGLPKVNFFFEGLEGGLLAHSPSSLLSWAFFYPCRVLPSGFSLLARLSWTHPWANSASAVASCAICIYTKGRLVEGVLTHVRATSLRLN